MSLIFGIFNRNGKPVEQSDLDDMYSAVSYYPHEKYDYIIKDNVAFAHMLTYNTPESLYEEQPIYLEDQHILFVFKGRIDNRKELIELLNLKSDNITDGEIALKAWMKWQTESFNKILGDWAFASFNYKTQELYLSRDHHGYTAINYYCDDKRIIFASSIKSILKYKDLNVEINEEAVLRTLAIWSSGRTDITYYKDIYKLNPATYIKIDKENFELRRYWYPENIKTNNSKKLDDYVEEFNQIFNIAVKDRLRSHKPVASMLSGGLDSGAVSYIAAMLLKNENKRLTTYSHVPLYKVSENIGSSRFGDEKPFIESTVKASGNIDPIYLRSENISVLDGILKVIEVFNAPIHAAINSYWLVDVIKSAADDGFGVLLTGEHGNATISFTGLEDILPLNQYYNLMGLKHTLKKRFLKPIIKGISEELFLKLKKNNNLSLESYSYINSELFTDIKEKMKIENHDDTFSFDFKNSNDLAMAILQPGSNPRCYFGGTFSDYYGIEQRDPTADKRVVEYLLSIPNEMFFSKDGKNKQIIKKMMNGKLPDNVLYTNKKGLQSADIGFRAANEKEKISKEINKLYKSDYVNKIIDMNKLKNDWVYNISNKDNTYNTMELHHILRTFMVGNFMMNFDKIK